MLTAARKRNVNRAVGRPVGKLSLRARTRRGLVAALVPATAALALPAAAPAAVTIFGSDLSAPASLDTVNHVLPRNHHGADTTLWNVKLGNGSNPAVPADGQIVKIEIKGCTRLTPGAPPPAGMPQGGTEVRFQGLAPQPDGSFKVEHTTAGFLLPVCADPGGPGTATQDTISTFQPPNYFCVRTGYSVAFTDYGGFDPQHYPNGIPYQVIGRVPGSTLNSYIKNEGTKNGAVFSPSDTGQANGFAVNPDEEVLVRATLATGPDAVWMCPGGSKGRPGSGTGGGGSPTGATSPTAPVKLTRQAIGVNRKRIARVAIFCAAAGPCSGQARLIARKRTLGSARFTIPARKTSKVAVRLTKKALATISKNRRRLGATLRVAVGGQTFATPVTLKI